jgi:hypothetical protein
MNFQEFVANYSQMLEIAIFEMKLISEFVHNFWLDGSHLYEERK